MKQYGPNSGVNRVKVTGLDLETIRQRILTAPDQITQEVAEELKQIGAQAVRDMRERVEQSVTVTGQKAQAAGKRSTAGRVRGRAEAATSGRPRTASGGRSMRDAIDQEVRINKRSVSLRFGWITGRPGYAFFQEYGTSNGVPAMHALTDASVKAHVELKKALGKVKYGVNK
jgi:hypothetical protein